MSDENGKTTKKTPEEMKKDAQDLEERIQETERRLQSGEKSPGFRDDYKRDVHDKGEARHDD